MLIVPQVLLVDKLVLLVTMVGFEVTEITESQDHRRVS